MAKENHSEIMWLAAEAGDTNELASVLRKNNDVDAANAHGTTALMRAAAAGKVQTARFLLEHGADPNRPRNDGFTPLLLAAFFGHKDVVRTLIEHGADARAATRFGTSAGMWASARTYKEVVDYLQEAKPPRESSEDKKPAEMVSVVATRSKFSARVIAAGVVFLLLSGIATATTMRWLRKPAQPVITPAVTVEAKPIVDHSSHREETALISREPAPETTPVIKDKEQRTSITPPTPSRRVRKSKSAHVQLQQASTEKSVPQTRPVVTTDVAATPTYVLPVKTKIKQSRPLPPPSSLLVSPSKGSAKSGRVIAWP